MITAVSQTMSLDIRCKVEGIYYGADIINARLDHLGLLWTNSRRRMAHCKRRPDESCTDADFERAHLNHGWQILFQR